MTNPPVSQRFVAAVAAAISEGRASLGHPAWNEPGIAVAVRRAAEQTPLLELLIAFARAAADGTNDTPAAVLHANNRAWDSDGYPPCKTHPRASRRTDGECGGCYADRSATSYVIPHRQGVPPSAEARAAMLTAINRGTR